MFIQTIESVGTFESPLHEHVHVVINSGFLHSHGQMNMYPSMGLLAHFLSAGILSCGLHPLPIYNAVVLGSPTFGWELVLHDLGL